MDFPKAEIHVAGFPCVSWSPIGKKQKDEGEDFVHWAAWVAWRREAQDSLLESQMFESLSSESSCNLSLFYLFLCNRIVRSILYIKSKQNTSVSSIQLFIFNSTTSYPGNRTPVGLNKAPFAVPLPEKSR